MLNKIEALSNNLKDIIDSYDDSLLVTFEGTLYDIHILNDYRIISKLLPLLKDDFDFDELMFSIIHTIEVFDDEIYIKELFETLPNFIYNSPRWASIVFMRILNNEPSLEVFKLFFIDLNNEKRSSIKNLFMSMREVDEEIANMVSPFINND